MNRQGSKRITTKVKRSLWLLFGLLCLVLGCVTAGSIGRPIDDLTGPHPECSWSTVKGTITGSDLQNYVRPNGEDDWQFTVTYTYEVGGTRHSAQQRLRDFLVVETPNIQEYAQVSYLFQTCVDLPNATEATALFRAAHDKSQFFLGKPVVVYFNPVNSDEAVLAPGLVSGFAMTYGEGIELCVTLALVFGGIIMMIKGILALRNP